MTELPWLRVPDKRDRNWLIAGVVLVAVPATLLGLLVFLLDREHPVIYYPLVGGTAGLILAYVLKVSNAQDCPICGQSMGKPRNVDSTYRASKGRQLKLGTWTEIVKGEGFITREVVHSEPFFLCFDCDREFRPEDIARALSKRDQDQQQAESKMPEELTEHNELPDLNTSKSAKRGKRRSKKRRGKRRK